MPLAKSKIAQHRAVCRGRSRSPRKRTQNSSRWYSTCYEPAFSLNGIYGTWRARPNLLRLDVGRSDHLAPLLDLFGDELGEVGGRARKHSATKIGKPRLHFGVGEGRVDLLIELVDDLSRRILVRTK